GRVGDDDGDNGAQRHQQDRGRRGFAHRARCSRPNAERAKKPRTKPASRPAERNANSSTSPRTQSKSGGERRPDSSTKRPITASSTPGHCPVAACPLTKATHAAHTKRVENAMTPASRRRMVTVPPLRRR